MEILILCGVFSKQQTEDIIKNATAPVEFSANLFQERLINGFNKFADSQNVMENNDRLNISVLSAPFIGAYPTASRTKIYKGFSDHENGYTYVKFNNIWGIRNFSRTRSLKKKIKSFAKSDAKEKIIVVYCTHTPFIKAAEYAKKLDPEIKICLYVPDLPQYMNLSANRSFIYDVAKKYDIASMTKHMKSVDSYVLLTNHMKNCLPVGEKPYFVAEGIFDSVSEPKAFKKHSGGEDRYIVYTGKLDEKFGAKALIDSMKHIKDDNIKLVICGNGDSYEYALKESEKDNRIMPQGQVTPDIAEMWRAKADVLINPRSNDEEYTKYSFPSKNVEYLLSGKPTVAYMLDGMTSEYKNFIFEIQPSNTPDVSVASALNDALNADDEEISRKSKSYYQYALQYLSSEKIAQRIIEINK